MPKMASKKKIIVASLYEFSELGVSILSNVNTISTDPSNRLKN